MVRIDPEFEALIPPLSDEEFAALELSIMTEGCRDAIVVWQHDGDDIIVDGHNRYRICTAAGLPYNTVTRDFSGRDEVMLWMIRNQLARRNLNDGMRLNLAWKLQSKIADMAEKAHRANGGDKKSADARSASATLQTPIDKTETARELGRAAETSTRKVYQYQYIRNNAPAELLERVHNGEITVNRAETFARELAKHPQPVVALALRLADDNADKVAILANLHKSNGKDGSNGTFDEIATNGGFHYGDEMDEWCDFAADSVGQIRAALASVAKYHQVIEKTANIERRIERAIELANQSKPMPEREYMLIYADPPWRYDFSATSNREIENHYPTMSIEDICALEPPAAKDCVLFMWATNPKLAEAFQVIEAWGFEYVTNMVWVKDKIGMGYYARQQHELLLIAKRNNGPVPEPANRPPSVIEAARGVHSRKPEQIYDMLDRMYPGLPKIELFSRTARKGWDSWGYEAGE